KNNSSHLDITPCVQVCAVQRMLTDTDPRAPGRYKGDRRVRRVLAGKRNQLVKSLGAFEPFDSRRISSWQGRRAFRIRKVMTTKKRKPADDQGAKKSRT